MERPGNDEPTFIENSSHSYGHCARENAAWADITLDMLEYDIDLKILHLNRQEAAG